MKRGAGSQKQAKVVIMTESELVDNPHKGPKAKRANHIKMQIISEMKADTVTDIAKEQVDSQAELTADDSRSYKKLGKYLKSHDAQVVKPEDLPKILPWVHIPISNVKRTALVYTPQTEKRVFTILSQ
ncbi:hypothetical protein EZS27_020177 [termite gut metagenome]|uniref:ISXO2-like transposase domain-containing protein n=1 Tax=termite gut metagenome TaxID=433724 RepID=A0A5J4RDE9_9ZZZZ